MWKQELIPFYSNPEVNDKKNPIDDDIFSLYYDKETNGIFKSEYIANNYSKNLSLNLILIPVMRFFPNELIPYDNLFYFIILSLFLFFLSSFYGYKLYESRRKNVRRISLTDEEWNYYLEEANKKYILQIIFVLFLCAFMLITFIFSYFTQSKWWFFGAIGLSFSIGVTSDTFSKIRYLLYKNKITPDLTRGESEDGTITHW